MILVDTSVWIAFFRQADSPYTLALDSLLAAKEVLAGDLIAAEVLQGIKGAREEKLIASALLQLPTRDLCGIEIAGKAATNYRRLRGKGITVRGTIDMIIATWCIENDTELLHNDRDFTIMESELGLKIYNRLT
ncbi:PIN domain nuclease [Mesorhizobium sp. LHD-90]|uniref:type II toxin-antitoxin system VapC family toxin n=1 Tax=Mesorhizobium sp. LHD-90 TaxID=3071414 RepID=UPI0027E19E70|nr:PIN domain nuclease [Mesorhizobium sp. LHD-90]MDQ6434322.1 PIN domain nuclease [Mesorhizobium sp. LHD-90]